MTTSAHPDTPIVVGVGQSAESIDDAGYRGLSAVELAAAARAALQGHRRRHPIRLKSQRMIGVTNEGARHRSDRTVWPGSLPPPRCWGS